MHTIAVAIAFVVVVAIIVGFATIAASLTVAQVDDGRLNFSFCGVRKRSFALDAGTTFELRSTGRLNVLIIRSGRSRYVPSGALDTGELIDLLRQNRVRDAS